MSRFFYAPVLFGLAMVLCSPTARAGSCPYSPVECPFVLDESEGDTIAEQGQPIVPATTAVQSLREAVVAGVNEAIDLQGEIDWDALAEAPVRDTDVEVAAIVQSLREAVVAGMNEALDLQGQVDWDALVEVAPSETDMLVEDFEALFVTVQEEPGYQGRYVAVPPIPSGEYNYAYEMEAAPPIPADEYSAWEIEEEVIADESPAEMPVSDMITSEYRGECLRAEIIPVQEVERLEIRPLVDIDIHQDMRAEVRRSIIADAVMIEQPTVYTASCNVIEALAGAVIDAVEESLNLPPVMRMAAEGAGVEAE